MEQYPNFTPGINDAEKQLVQDSLAAAGISEEVKDLVIDRLTRSEEDDNSLSIITRLDELVQMAIGNLEVAEALDILIAASGRLNQADYNNEDEVPVLPILRRALFKVNPPFQLYKTNPEVKPRDQEGTFANAVFVIKNRTSENVDSGFFKNPWKAGKRLLSNIKNYMGGGRKKFKMAEEQMMSFRDAMLRLTEAANLAGDSLIPGETGARRRNAVLDSMLYTRTRSVTEVNPAGQVDGVDVRATQQALPGGGVETAALQPVEVPQAETEDYDNLHRETQAAYDEMAEKLSKKKNWRNKAWAAFRNTTRGEAGWENKYHESVTEIVRFINILSEASVKSADILREAFDENSPTSKEDYLSFLALEYPGLYTIMMSEYQFRDEDGAPESKLFVDDVFDRKNPAYVLIAILRYLFGDRVNVGTDINTADWFEMDEGMPVVKEQFIDDVLAGMAAEGNDGAEVTDKQKAQKAELVRGRLGEVTRNEATVYSKREVVTQVVDENGEVTAENREYEVNTETVDVLADLRLKREKIRREAKQQVMQARIEAMGGEGLTGMLNINRHLDRLVMMTGEELREAALRGTAPIIVGGVIVGFMAPVGIVGSGALILGNKVLLRPLIKNFNVKGIPDTEAIANLRANVEAVLGVEGDGVAAFGTNINRAVDRAIAGEIVDRMERGLIDMFGPVTIQQADTLGDNPFGLDELDDNAGQPAANQLGEGGETEEAEAQVSEMARNVEAVTEFLNSIGDRSVDEALEGMDVEARNDLIGQLQAVHSSLHYLSAYEFKQIGRNTPAQAEHLAKAKALYQRLTTLKLAGSRLTVDLSLAERKANIRLKEDARRAAAAKVAGDITRAAAYAVIGRGIRKLADEVIDGSLFGAGVQAQEFGDGEIVVEVEGLGEVSFTDDIEEHLGSFHDADDLPAQMMLEDADGHPVGFVVQHEHVGGLGDHEVILDIDDRGAIAVGQVNTGPEDLTGDTRMDMPGAGIRTEFSLDAGVVDTDHPVSIGGATPFTGEINNLSPGETVYVSADQVSALQSGQMDRVIVYVEAVNDGEIGDVDFETVIMDRNPDGTFTMLSRENILPVPDGHGGVDYQFVNANGDLVTVDTLEEAQAGFQQALVEDYGADLNHQATPSGATLDRGAGTSLTDQEAVSLNNRLGGVNLDEFNNDSNILEMSRDSDGAFRTLLDGGIYAAENDAIPDGFNWAGMPWGEYKNAFIQLGDMTNPSLDEIFQGSDWFTFIQSPDVQNILADGVVSAEEYQELVGLVDGFTMGGNSPFSRQQANVIVTLLTQRYTAEKLLNQLQPTS